MIVCLTDARADNMVGETTPMHVDFSYAVYMRDINRFIFYPLHILW